MKFEAVQIHFLSDVFGFVVIHNFASMVIWRNDFSSLFKRTVLDSGFHAVESGFQALDSRFLVCGTKLDYGF